MITALFLNIYFDCRAIHLISFFFDEMDAVMFKELSTECDPDLYELVYVAEDPAVELNESARETRPREDRRRPRS